ncbi:hypothetical protein H257_06387 [Aphanomyces astaci]|uniref:DDE Tnp4 domain-containing protein n=1 Tax=Aphanomyces astaci TaxID=112090 RepID=W4GMN1_APHAT|nr:hypothetical protein H257_06387 [Aphanomyces astaci]ETV80942.1 hypothetical protein H257_06387 [Aphanomyces astaci]|eukprot:XP_009829889.1 hypothetical protein H257_06387 [Aphanomyces astaci]
MRLCRDQFDESDSDEDDLNHELLHILRTIKHQRFSVVRSCDPFTLFAVVRGKVAKSPVSHHLLVFLNYMGANGNAVWNEHMASFFGIGAGTGRFQHLKRIRKIMDRKAAMTSIIKTIIAASILHNILVTENDIVPASWIELQVNCNCNADLRGCRVCFPIITVEHGDAIESDE